MNATVAIVIVNHNGSAYISSAVSSALSQKFSGSIHVIVVDNASSDDSLDVLRKFSGITVLENQVNVGYGAAVNTALHHTTADFIALLNPDAQAESNWIAKMIPWMIAERVDLASSVIADKSGTWFAGGRFFECIGATMVYSHISPKNDWVSGCALVATQEAMKTLSGFDEGFFLYYEDVDLSLRARAAGFKIQVMPESLVSHPSEGRSTNTLGRRKAQIGYYARGRLIRKHVRGWRTLPALAFAAFFSPPRNGVGASDLWPVASALFRGFRDARSSESKERVSRAKRPNVGVLLNCYERTAGLGAGGNRHFVEVIRRWGEFDLVLFGPRSAREAVLAELPRVQYVVLPSLESGSKGKAVDFLFRSVAWILYLPHLRRCDVMLATSPFLPDIVPAVFSGRPVVAIIHHLIGPTGTAMRESRIPYISEEVALFIVKRCASAVVVSSQMLAHELRARSFRMPVLVTTSGVDHIPEPSGEASEASRTGALFIGRLHPAKGALDAVRAWRHVVDFEPTAILTLIGAREVETYVHEIETLIRETGLERNVILRGKVSDSEKIDAMSKARVFIFPSYEEGWGIALAEAMRASLPCVTYSLPIFDEIFPKGRLIATVGDADGLARHTLLVLQDESTRERLRSEAVSLAADFSWDRASSIEREAVQAFIVS